MTSLLRRIPVIGAFALGLLASASAEAAPVLNEIMASNRTTLADEDGDYSDWIELHNPDATPVSLDGWYLTDKPGNKTKWRLPAVILPPDGYLVIFASGKNRAVPGAPLHASFKLSADGDYLGLIEPDGVTVGSEFAPGFPPQFTDLSYGVTQPVAPAEPPQTGYFSVATPGARNGDASALTLGERVTFSRGAGIFRGELQVELAGAAAGQTIRYVVADPGAAGAEVPAPTADSPEYTTPLAISRSVVVAAAVFAADGLRHGAVTQVHYLKLDDTTPARLDTFASQLPVIVLDDHGYGPLVKDDIDHPSWFYLFAPGPAGATSLLTVADQASAALMSVRGATSSLFPKKSFKFELVDAAGRANPQSLLQLPSLEEWNLIGPWKYDRSYIRNAIAYALSNRIGRWAPRTRLAEVFFNQNGGPLDATDYAGIYVLSDKLEEGPARVAITKLGASDAAGDALTGGYILRVDEPDPEKYSWTTDHDFPHQDASVMMVESPKAAKLSSAQRDYIRGYIQEAENALYADQAAGFRTHAYLDYFDRASWVDHHLLNTFLKNTDAFWRSAYFTKDRLGKLTAGPIWDFDRSMDSADPRDDNWDTWSLTKYTSQGAAIQYWEFGWWGVLAQDPDFMQAWIDRWQTLRDDAFSDVKLAATVDEFTQEVGPAAAARDAAAWPDNVSEHGDYAGETAHLREWLVKRAQWIDTQFVAPPAAGSEDALVRVVPAAGARLAFTVDGTDPRLPGGALRPTAQVVDHDVIFVDASRVRVRSYRPELASAFPGSPWSRLVAPASDHGAAGEAPWPGLSREVAADLGADLALGPADGVTGNVTYQWYRNDEAIAGETGPVLHLTHLLDSDSATYALIISGSAGDLATISYRVTVSGSVNLANLSSRARVGSGEDILIGGFVVESETPKNYLLRAVGPTLAHYGIGQPLAVPTLRVYRGDGTLVASNTGWETAPDPAALAAAAHQVGAFELLPGSRDSALLLSLPKGVYSLHASGADGGSGVSLGEIYALDEAGSPLNLSARARVRPGEDVLIGGLVISGTHPRRVLIRAVGPGLAGYGVAGPLNDPTLQVMSGTTVLVQNDNWETGNDAAEIAATSAAVGAFALPAGSADSAVIADLEPGVYSVLVRGKGNATGVALVEIYAVK